MQLFEIRKQYEQNYREIIQVIAAMGGDQNIRLHRKTRSALYLKLKKLQKREHQLDALENKFRSQRQRFHN